VRGPLAGVGLDRAPPGAAARRARPVAQDIGAGRLSSRAQLDRRERGEAGLLADAIDEMATRIERQLADQRELLAVVSHELRTPLQRMRVLIDILHDEAGADRAVAAAAAEPGAARRAHLEQLEREVLEIDALVGELLAGARLDFTALDRRPLDGAALAREALQRAGLDPGLLDVAAAAPFAGDPTLLARALANLVGNASQHGGGLTCLRVWTTAEGGVTFEAQDRGAGFPPGGAERAFEPFRPPRAGDVRRGRPDQACRPRAGPGARRAHRARPRRHGPRRQPPEGGASIGFTIPARAPARAA